VAGFENKVELVKGAAVLGAAAATPGPVASTSPSAREDVAEEAEAVSGVQRLVRPR
jgi:hypothetical protein